MSLRKKQSKFALMVAQLVFFALSKGYELTYGDTWASSQDEILKILNKILPHSDDFPYSLRMEMCKIFSRHSKNSKHPSRLAIDLNLFKDGKYLTKTEDHRPLGEFWQSLGGTWGGDWDDGNHYQL